MKDTKIYKALNTLSVYELNAFRKFLQSPYFNKNEKLTILGEAFINDIKSNPSTKLTKESSWTSVEPDSKFDNLKFRKLNSDLLKLFEEFITYEQFNSEKNKKLSTALKAIEHRKIDVLYNSITNKIKRYNEIQLEKSSDYFYYRYYDERNIFNLKSEYEKESKKADLQKEINIREISDNLDLFYTTEKLRYYCTLLSWRNKYDLDIEIENINDVISLIKKYNLTRVPSIAVYYQITLLYSTEDSDIYYHKLKRLIKKFRDYFPQDEIRDIYDSAKSYCINRINKGNRDFQIELFDVYKETLSDINLWYGSSFPPTTFLNIITIALRLNQFEWTEEFIVKYSEYLDEKIRDNAFNFSLARLNFYQKNYPEVIDYLNKVSYEDVWYNLSSKSILLLVYYELDEIDALDSLISSFKAFISREKSLSKNRKNPYFEHLKFLKKLSHTNPNDKDKLKALKADIEATSGVVNKPWLLEKIEELL